MTWLRGKKPLFAPTDQTGDCVQKKPETRFWTWHVSYGIYLSKVLKWRLNTKFRFFCGTRRKNLLIIAILPVKMLFLTTCVMGWLWSVGSIKLQFYFAEYRFFNWTLLQKRPIICTILLIEATPYAWLGLILLAWRDSFIWQRVRVWHPTSHSYTTFCVGGIE